MIKNKKKQVRLTWSSIPKILVNALILCYSLTCVFPLLWLFNSSLRTNNDFMANVMKLATDPVFENYKNAIRIGKMGEYLGNSLYLTTVSVVVGTVLAFIVAYCLARYQFRGKKAVYYLFLFGMIVPTLSLMIPVFLQFKLLKLRDKWYTLFFPYIAYSLPTAILMVESYIKSLPRDLDEAALLDGCTKSQMMFRIIMPLCKPILAVVVVWNFMTTWNEFPFALVLLNKPELYPISIGMRSFAQQYTIDYPLQMAALLLSTLPVLVIYFCLSEKVMESMTVGAVKL